MSGRAPTTAGDLLTLPELRRTSALRGAGLVAHAWAVIAGATLLYAAWPSVFTLLVAVAVIGTRQLGLAILMHEAAHWLLFPSQPANTRVGAWLCAHPVFGDLQRYRRRHHLHHRHAQQPDDPDLALTTPWPMAPGAFWLAVLVFVPCWRLPDAHALLLAKGHGPSMELAPGYLDVIRRATTVRSAS